MNYEKELLDVGGKAGRWTTRETIAETSPDVQGGRIENVDKPIMLITMGTSFFSPGLEVAPDATSMISFSSSIPWRGRGFSVPADLAWRFLITSMRCARVEFACNDSVGVSCAPYSDATCAKCRRARIVDELGGQWPVVYPGSPLVLVVKNRSDAPSHFEATFEAEPIHIPYPDPVI